jgi:hypothetical protein
MQTPYNVKLLHVEPTTYCNAHCPQCERNINGGELNPLVPLVHLDPDLFQRQLDRYPDLEKVLFCGNRGDPLMTPYFVDMVSMAKKRDLTVGINTNGSIGTTLQWYELAHLLNGLEDYCVFSIDGLEDTNHIYRHGVNWRHVMRNAEAFILGGGQAHWDMLVFDHNRLQVEACEQLAQDMGFRWFRTKETKRFKQAYQITAYGAVISPVKFVERKPTGGDVTCMAQSDSSVYLDAEGRTWPCCWLATARSHSGIAEISNFDNPWPELETIWQRRDWLDTCTRTCTGQDNAFKSQWKKEVKL